MLIGKALDSDCIVEPVRGPLIPGFAAVKRAAKAAGMLLQIVSVLFAAEDIGSGIPLLSALLSNFVPSASMTVPLWVNG